MANTRTIRQNQAVSGDLAVAGNSALTGTLSVSGAVTLPGGVTGGLVVSGNSTFNNNLTVTGNLTVNGSFSFAGGSVFPDNTFAIQNVSDVTKQLMFSIGGATTNKTLTLVSAHTDNRSITYPDASTTLVGTDTMQTLTSKTLDAGSNVISNLADANIASLANIALSKLASLSANRAVVTDASGFLVASSVTDTQIGYLGAVTAAVVDISSMQTLTNKSIDASANTLSNIADASISASAAIARSKIASGSANQVLINDGSGNLSSEAQLAPSRGGTGQDFSASTGILAVAGGTVSARTIVDADVDAAAAIARSKIAAGTANHVVVNDGSGNLSSVSKLPESQGGTNQSTYAAGDMLYASATNTLSTLAAGSPGQAMKINDSGLPAYDDWINASVETKLFDDWITDGTGQLRWLGTVVGAGANNATGTTIASAGHPGILELITGTTTTGQAARYLGGVATGAATAGFFAGGGISSQEWLVYFDNLSNGTDTYTADFGLFGAETLAVDAIRLRYSSGTSANWLAETISASAVTTTDSGVAVASGSWIKLRIDINSAGTSVDFYINGSLVATNTTNIPSVVIAPRCRIIKSAGTTSRTAYVDYFKMYKRFSSAR